MNESGKRQPGSLDDISHFRRNKLRNAVTNQHCGKAQWQYDPCARTRHCWLILLALKFSQGMWTVRVVQKRFAAPFACHWTGKSRAGSSWWALLEVRPSTAVRMLYKDPWQQVVRKHGLICPNEQGRKYLLLRLLGMLVDYSYFERFCFHSSWELLAHEIRV